jgi:hypothetical protein
LFAEEIGNGTGAFGGADSGDEDGLAEGEKAKGLFAALWDLRHKGGVGFAEFGESNIGGAVADTAEHGAPVFERDDGGAGEDAGGVGANKVGGGGGDAAAGKVLGNGSAAGGAFDDTVKGFKPGGGDVGGAGEAGDVGGAGEEVDCSMIEGGAGALGDEDPVETDASAAGGLGKDVFAEAGGVAIGTTGDEGLGLVVANVPRLGTESA